jgi:hypothetical protein
MIDAFGVDDSRVQDLIHLAGWNILLNSWRFKEDIFSLKTDDHFHEVFISVVRSIYF